MGFSFCHVALVAGLLTTSAPALRQSEPAVAREAPPQEQKAPPPPQPAHTGLKALFIETGNAFVAFPKRKSTWVILGIGLAGAAAVHPIDDELNSRLAGSDAAAKFFAPGKYIGSVYVQLGVATGLYVTGRYVLPHAEGGPQTNKVSHIGFDMFRAIIVSQVLTQAIKF